MSSWVDQLLDQSSDRPASTLRKEHCFHFEISTTFDCFRRATIDRWPPSVERGQRVRLNRNRAGVWRCAKPSLSAARRTDRIQLASLRPLEFRPERKEDQPGRDQLETGRLSNSDQSREVELAMESTLMDDVGLFGLPLLFVVAVGDGKH